MNKSVTIRHPKKALIFKNSHVKENSPEALFFLPGAVTATPQTVYRASTIPHIWRKIGVC
jgi:hypothetical protein